MIFLVSTDSISRSTIKSVNLFTYHGSSIRSNYQWYLSDDGTCRSGSRYFASLLFTFPRIFVCVSSRIILSCLKILILNHLVKLRLHYLIHPIYRTTDIHPHNIHNSLLYKPIFHQRPDSFHCIVVTKVLVMEQYVKYGFCYLTLLGMFFIEPYR